MPVRPDYKGAAPMKVARFMIEFLSGDEVAASPSINIQLQYPVCPSCGQDHKKNVELTVYDSKHAYAAHGPATKTRHETFEAAYAEAKKQFPVLP